MVPAPLGRPIPVPVDPAQPLRRPTGYPDPDRRDQGVYGHCRDGPYEEGRGQVLQLPQPLLQIPRAVHR